MASVFKCPNVKISNCQDLKSRAGVICSFRHSGQEKNDSGSQGTKRSFPNVQTECQCRECPNVNVQSVRIYGVSEYPECPNVWNDTIANMQNVKG